MRLARDDLDDEPALPRRLDGPDDGAHRRVAHDAVERIDQRARFDEAQIATGRQRGRHIEPVRHFAEVLAGIDGGARCPCRRRFGGEDQLAVGGLLPPQVELLHLGVADADRRRSELRQQRAPQRFFFDLLAPARHVRIGEGRVVAGRDQQQFALLKVVEQHRLCRIGRQEDAAGERDGGGLELFHRHDAIAHVRDGTRLRLASGNCEQGEAGGGGGQHDSAQWAVSRHVAGRSDGQWWTITGHRSGNPARTEAARSGPRSL